MDMDEKAEGVTGKTAREEGRERRLARAGELRASFAVAMLDAAHFIGRGDWDGARGSLAAAGAAASEAVRMCRDWDAPAGVAAGVFKAKALHAAACKAHEYGMDGAALGLCAEAQDAAREALDALAATAE